MISINSKSLILLIVALLFIYSCAKDEEITPMEKEDALELIGNTSLLMDQTVNQMMETEGIVLMNRFMALSESSSNEIEINVSSYLIPQKSILFSLKKSLKSVDPSYDTPFGDYGTYTWNQMAYNWDFEPIPTDKIIYLFPVDDLDEENSASLTISQIQQDIESDGFVSAFVISLKNNQNEVFGVDYTATLTDSSIDKIIVDINFFPYSISTNQQFDSKNGGTLINSSNTFKNQGVTLMSSKLEIETVNQVMISPENLEQVDEVQIDNVFGYVQIGSLKFTLDFSFADFYDDVELSPSELEMIYNKNLKIKLYEYPSGVPVAYVTWYYLVGESSIEPYFVFSDGSEEMAINYLPENFVELLDDEDTTQPN